jgi:hypothetical protein
MEGLPYDHVLVLVFNTNDIFGIVF